MKVLDYQVEQLYKWERDSVWTVDDPKLTLSECQDIVNNVWADYFPLIEPPEVRDGRGQLNARSNGYCLWLPRWSRMEDVVLHELSHSLLSVKLYGTEQYEPVIGHDSVFVRMFIELLVKYSSKKHDVKYLLDTASKYELHIAENSLQPIDVRCTDVFACYNQEGFRQLVMADREQKRIY